MVRVEMGRCDSNVPDNAISFKPKLFEYTPSAMVVTAEEIIVIELCTQAKSSIYHAGNERKVTTMQVTREEDLLHPQTVHQVTHIIEKFKRVALWMSPPRSALTGTASSGMAKHKLVKILETFRKIAQLVKNKGGIIHLEWPTQVHGRMGSPTSP